MLSWIPKHMQITSYLVYGEGFYTYFIGVGPMKVLKE
jgi:hypothetical protein